MGTPVDRNRPFIAIPPLIYSPDELMSKKDHELIVSCKNREINDLVKQQAHLKKQLADLRARLSVAKLEIERNRGRDVTSQFGNIMPLSRL